MSAHVPPVAQSTAPMWQGLIEGTHVAPGVHDAHAPASHTSPLPHGVPSVVGEPVSKHVLVPVWQVVRPRSQTLAGVQTMPETQRTQAPSLQTSFIAQIVPFAAVFACPVSTQAGLEEQSKVPRWHTSAGVHDAPHVMHLPAAQKLLAPHGVPSATFCTKPHPQRPCSQYVQPSWQADSGHGVDDGWPLL